VHGLVWVAGRDAAVEGRAEYPSRRLHFGQRRRGRGGRGWGLVLAWSGKVADVAQDVEHELVVLWLSARENSDDGVDGARLDVVL